MSDELTRRPEASRVLVQVHVSSDSMDEWHREELIFTRVPAVGECFRAKDGHWHRVTRVEHLPDPDETFDAEVFGVPDDRPQAMLAAMRASTDEVIRNMPDHKQSITPAERLGLRALYEARRRATARGLTSEDIDRESDDEESQFWNDARAIHERLLEDHRNRPQ